MSILGIAQIALETQYLEVRRTPYPESISAFRRALELDRNRAATWFNLGTSLSDAGYARDAVEAYRTCLSLDPSNESAKYNLSRSLLLLGEWQEGWKLYEARGRKSNPLYAPLEFERWNGEPPGKYVLVLTTEQGIGDAIQFVRFAPLLRRAGYEVLLWAPPLLGPLLKQVNGIGPVFTGSQLRITGSPVKWAPLMSIPAICGLTPQTVPSAPYIRVAAESVDNWGRKIGGHGFKIGIIWQGNTAHKRDKRRSIRLAELHPLAHIPEVRLISLQKSPGSAQIAETSFGSSIETYLDDTDMRAESLLETAAIMSHLDLVISVDTMPAHLAGALGRPVWLMLDDCPDWRWMLDSPTTPWYPAMRLFRQPTAGDWHSVVAAMVSAIRTEPSYAPLLPAL